MPAERVHRPPGCLSANAYTGPGTVPQRDSWERAHLPARRAKRACDRARTNAPPHAPFPGGARRPFTERAAGSKIAFWILGEKRAMNFLNVPRRMRACPDSSVVGALHCVTVDHGYRLGCVFAVLVSDRNVLAFLTSWDEWGTLTHQRYARALVVWEKR